MEYSKARSLIATGDLIAIRGKRGILASMTRYFTGPYTHTGLAIWLGGRLFMTELNSGRNHLVPLSQLSKGEFDVYAHPPELAEADLEAAIHEWLAGKVEYGYAAFVAIGLLEWLRIKMFVHWRRVMVCSGYCIANWERAGWPEHSRVMSPTALTKLVKLKFPVSPDQGETEPVEKGAAIATA